MLNALSCSPLQVAISVLSLLRYYKWMKFAIIYQEGAQWETIAKYLKDQVSDWSYFQWSMLYSKASFLEGIFLQIQIYPWTETSRIDDYISTINSLRCLKSIVGIGIGTNYSQFLVNNIDHLFSRLVANEHFVVSDWRFTFSMMLGDVVYHIICVLFHLY